MNKSCWSCKWCINDYFNTGTLDCTRMDDMTEEEAEDYYCNHGGENCPYYKPYMTDAEIEAKNKMIEKMKNNA